MQNDRETTAKQMIKHPLNKCKTNDKTIAKTTATETNERDDSLGRNSCTFPRFEFLTNEDILCAL